MAIPLLREGDVVHARGHWIRLGPVERYDQFGAVEWAAVGVILDPDPAVDRFLHQHHPKGTIEIRGGPDSFWQRKIPQEDR